MEGLEQIEDYEVVPVFITKEGEWQLHGNRVALLPDPAIGGLYLLDGESGGNIVSIDVVFPVLHGTFGEDGTIQGLLELARIPYVGAGVAGSAVGMDKILMKAVLKSFGLPVGDYLWFTATKWKKDRTKLVEDIAAKLGFPCFVKPANLGSSVGISKVYKQFELEPAVEEALQYDHGLLWKNFARQ